MYIPWNINDRRRLFSCDKIEKGKRVVREMVGMKNE
jgi:hypothetical protein